MQVQIENNFPSRKQNPLAHLNLSYAVQLEELIYALMLIVDEEGGVIFLSIVRMKYFSFQLVASFTSNNREIVGGGEYGGD